MLAAATGRGFIAAVGTRAGAALLAWQSMPPLPHDEGALERPYQLWTDYARDWHAELRRGAG